MFIGQAPTAKGYLVGGIYSLLNLQLLAATAQRAIIMPPEQARIFTFQRYLVRYIVTSLVLILVLLRPDMNIWGAVVGLLTTKLVLYAWATGQVGIFVGRKLINRLERGDIHGHGRRP